jgi:hypothetical protein
MECFGTTDFDNNSRLITLSAIIISGLHCIYIYTKPDDGPFGSKHVVSCEQKLFDYQFVVEFESVLIQWILVMSHRCH